VLRFDSWGGVDKDRMRALIDSSFAPRQLAAEYFECTQPYRIYVSENYRTAMILTLEHVDKEQGLPYLDKFAVLDEAQGEGLGRAVWQVMRAENPKLFWRSRHGNRINAFYHEQSDGCFKESKFKVFWYGLGADFETIERCVAHSAQRKATLIEESHGE
jgi:acetylglutamate kinase